MNNMLHKCSLVIICGTYIITLNSFCVPVYGNIREIRSPQTNWWQESQSQQQNPNGNVVEEKLDSQSSQQRKNDFVLIYNKGNNTLVEVRGKWSTRSGDDTLNNSPQEFSNTSNGNTYNEYDNSLSPPILSSHEERPEQPSPPSVPLPSLPLPQLPHEYWPPPRPPLPPPPHGSPLAPALHLGLPPPPYVKQLFDSQYRERNGQQLNYYRRPPPVPPPPPPLLYDQLYYQDKRSPQYPSPPYRRGWWNNIQPDVRHGGPPRGIFNKGPSPDHHGPPPDYPETPSDYRGPPPNHRGLPPDHRGPPSYYHRQPPNYRELPPGHRGSPPGHRGSPPGHRGSPPGHQDSPPGHRGLPSDRQTPPLDNQGLKVQEYRDPYDNNDQHSNERLTTATNEKQIDIRYESGGVPKTTDQTITVNVETLNKIFGSATSNKYMLTTDGVAPSNNNKSSNTVKIPPHIFQVAPVTPDD
ncbi:uncharacterized protein LOC113523512 isoform X2 [Galleria mellonella]|uniref:Uncharacterized protein LOC113523512 isoform X2 n=1 Tax=Galleria mellonella TaxID=7137 RepID=A0A6J3BU43_GALME|nr:uncharacterized protein LOC113523512 isoform X2 [Galleria mellonella]